MEFASIEKYSEKIYLYIFKKSTNYVLIHSGFCCVRTFPCIETKSQLLSGLDFASIYECLTEKWGLK